MERLVEKYIFDPEISAGKMIFLCGPRQVGKTTFALNWLASMGVEGTYFNWDDPAVKKEYNRNPLCFKNIVLAKFHGKSVPVVFDERHAGQSFISHPLRFSLQALPDIPRALWEYRVSRHARNREHG